jgi:hypothetical protein
MLMDAALWRCRPWCWCSPFVNLAPLGSWSAAAGMKGAGRSCVVVPLSSLEAICICVSCLLRASRSIQFFFMKFQLRLQRHDEDGG